MDDDAFDRALRREQELRDLLEAGHIDEAEIDTMRDFDAYSRGDLALDLDQARRLVEGGVDPAVVAEIVGHFGRISLDEAIDIAADYGVDTDTILDLVRAGTPRDLTADALIEVFDNDIDAELLRLIVASGFSEDAAVSTSVALAKLVCDPQDTLESLRRADLSGLTVEQIATIADYEINPRVVRRLLDGDPELDVDGALRLLLNDDDDEAEAADRDHVGVRSTLGDQLDLSVAAIRFGASVVRDVARLVTAGRKWS